jgi:hypothetical protein
MVETQEMEVLVEQEVQILVAPEVLEVHLAHQQLLRVAYHHFMVWLEQ